MTANLEARRQMHYAEHLARQHLSCPAHMISKIEQAYQITTEPRVAQRISAALDLI